MEHIKNNIIPESWKVNNYKYESQLQADSIVMINREFPRLRDLTWHTKNENFIPRKEGEGEQEYKNRCIKEGAKDKAQGKKAGGHDIFIRYRGILYGLELKMPSGTLKSSQEKFHEAWKKDFDNGTSVVVRTLEEIYNYCVWILGNGNYISNATDGDK